MSLRQRQQILVPPGVRTMGHDHHVAIERLPGAGSGWSCSSG